VSGIPSDLSEAQTLAKESLAMKETLSPAAAEIWKSYELLTRIAAKQGDSRQAAAYRAKSRQAYFAFPGWRQQLRQYERLIAAVVTVESNPVFRSDPEPVLGKIAEGGEVDLVTAIRRILNGERDETALCEPLNYGEAAVIRAILEGIDGQA
ncbi:MAG: hypothetical protein D3909_18620, partial [Candidatus Electrothrix sp. ATG1]|nr:hypothetical protein [Candidatus Electrothrix sp. ATG1]